MKQYTVILLYPGVESTYTTTVFADDPDEALRSGREAASVANEGAYDPEDFALVAVLAGTPEIELLMGDRE